LEVIRASDPWFRVPALALLPHTTLRDATLDVPGLNRAPSILSNITLHTVVNTPH